MLDDRRSPGARERTLLQALLMIVAASAVAALLGWVTGTHSPLPLCVGLVLGCGLAAQVVRSRDVGLVILTGPAVAFSVVAIPLLALAPSVLSAKHTDVDKILQTYNYGVPAMIAGAFVALLAAVWRHRRGAADAASEALNDT